ncbi:hypothetical protein QCA50_002042 [Cerrena zonata]|uniref:Sphingolipid long chain base-responsive protein LSP1 n=1 Tax=Cerrena zonata TaxID=2478898 RepID=A0AAW0GYL0_9APHY
MSGFFSSIANKAQSAINQHLPSSSAGGSNGQGTGSNRYSHTLESLHHQLRTFQQQYSSSTTPAQKIVTTQKGVAIDFDNVSRDVQANSKELYLWGQQDQDDLKDVSDRLAWLNYVQGQLASNLATQLNAARVPFKALRDAETALAPRRALRTNLENQIGKLENENSRAATQRISEVKTQLHRAQVEDNDAEKEILVLKRKALRESEQLKWQAMREYGEKLVLLSQAAETIVPVLPTLPPSSNSPYTGAESTANVRAALQRALDNYHPGASGISFPAATAADLQRSDTRSFGETHRRELDRIGSTDPSVHSGIPLTPPATAVPLSTYPAPAGPPPGTSTAGARQSPTPSHQSLPAGSPRIGATANSPPLASASSPPPGNQSPPLNPAKLNQAPAPIPIPIEKASPVVAPNPSDPNIKVSPVLPTVAETGLPKSAGPDGPGPASGSLLSIKAEHKATLPPGYGIPAASLSAEEEKKKLEREEREKLLAAGEGPSAAAGEPAKYESAEEEKKRLEREERERLLNAGGSSSEKGPGHGGPPDPDADADLPPYQEF